MTNVAWVDTTRCNSPWNLTINGSSIIAAGSVYGPQILVRRSDDSFRGTVSLSRNSSGGMIQYISSNPAVPHADFLAAGSTFCGDNYQINDPADGAGLGFMYEVTNNLTKANNYGVITMQRSAPDYLSTVVRSNSIGNGVLYPPWEETQVAYDPTNSYWVRLLQSDIGPFYYNTRNNSFEPPANYHMDNLVVNSNLTVSGNISGNGSGLTNAAGNTFLDKTATNSVVQTNDSRALNLGNAGNVFGGVQQYVDIPLMLFNPAPFSAGYTPSPFFTDPYFAATNFASYIEVPDWVTNVVTYVKYEWTGNVPLTYTNYVRGATHMPVIGRDQGANDCYTVFTIQPTNMCWVLATNSIYGSSQIGTNTVYKMMYFKNLAIGTATNNSGQLSIIQIRQFRTGEYSGNNW